MTVTSLGSLTVGDACPGAVAIATAGMAGIDAAAPNLQGQIDAINAVPVPPQSLDFPAAIVAAEEALLALKTALLTAIAPPSLDAGAFDANATLSANLGTVNVQLAAIEAFLSLFSTSGLVGWAFAGTGSAFGSEMNTAITSAGLSGSSLQAVVIATATPAAFAALSQLIKTTP